MLGNSPLPPPHISLPPNLSHYFPKQQQTKPSNAQRRPATHPLLIVVKFFSQAKIMLKASRAPERSNFAQTCNLLSQYVKEKGRTGDISLGMTRKLESKEKPETSLPVATTMDLLTNMENSADQALRQNTGTPSNAQSTDFLQQFGCFDPSNSSDVASNKPDFRKSATKEAATAQMTIFYAGQVLVFNDFPADKAREIMALGRMRSSYTSGMDKVNSRSCNIAPAASNIAATSQRIPTQAIASDLPIVRKASLHRFLEKRKDRVAAKAPYQANPPSQAPPKPKESNPWIDLDLEGQFSKQLELKL